MAIIGLDLSATERFVHPDDPSKGTPEETIWVLKTLPSSIQAYIADQGMDMVSVPTNKQEKRNAEETMEMAEALAEQASIRLSVNQNYRLYVKLGVEDVHNFVDGNGNAIAPSYKKMYIAGNKIRCLSDEFLNRIPARFFQALADRILQISSVTEGELTN